MITQKSVNVPNGSFPHAVLIPEGQYSHFPPIGVGRALTLIGSEDTVHVRLRSRTISPVHAMLLNADGRVILRDLASHSHVYVNSRLVREAVLHPGDKIRVGRIRFVFQPGEMTGVEAPAEFSPAQLWNQNGKVISIKGPIFVIGRRRDTDLVVSSTPEPAHALIFSIGGRRFLRHLKLSAPVSVNEQQIRQSLLDQGDVIDIYGEKYQFTFAPVESEQPIELPEALELSTVQANATVLVEASASETNFDSTDRSAPPEFDAGLSPLLSVDEAHRDVSAAIEAAQTAQFAPASDRLTAAAAALVTEVESFQASVCAANDLVSDIATPSVNERIGEPEESTSSAHSESFEPGRENATMRMARPPVSDDLTVSASEPAHENLVETFANHHSPTPSVEMESPDIEDPRAKTDNPLHGPIGLNITDEMLPFLKEWGPLAIAMLAEQRQDVLPAAPVTEEPAPNTRRWTLMSMVAAITLVVGIGALWLTLKGTL